VVVGAAAVLAEAGFACHVGEADTTVIHEVCRGTRMQVSRWSMCGRADVLARDANVVARMLERRCMM